MELWYRCIYRQCTVLVPLLRRWYGGGGGGVKSWSFSGLNRKIKGGLNKVYKHMREYLLFCLSVCICASLTDGIVDINGQIFTCDWMHNIICVYVSLCVDQIFQKVKMESLSFVNLWRSLNWLPFGLLLCCDEGELRGRERDGKRVGFDVHVR